MSPFFSSVLSSIHCEAQDSPPTLTGSALKSVRSAVAVPENELKRWRRVFDANAKVVINGEKCVI